MHKFMKSCVERYQEVARDATPGYVLEECDAPIINEVELPNPARTPFLNADGSTRGFVCLDCTEAFATGFHASKDATGGSNSVQALEQLPGLFALRL